MANLKSLSKAPVSSTLNHPHVPRHSHAALPPRLPSPHFARSGAIEEAAAALKRALKNVSRKKLVLRPASPRPPRSTRGRNGQEMTTRRHKRTRRAGPGDAEEVAKQRPSTAGGASDL
ncbi:hypothetical protein BLNAU_2041 [Blattamonas nauphoetae]|uniref:Uncharacterized protein n=1 Tax=Blattamonas nauphoetae TaxID=2049346 RepID=A0ABQ9YGY9_9EUKA|nr:hypothetical protein BLNAU_2041 [Blattamonas nauphoetae]